MSAAVDYASPRYYRHSGRFSPAGAAIALIGSLAVAIVLGAVYAYVDLYNPCFSVLTFFATLLFGLAVGWVTGYLLMRGQVRNDAMTLSIATLVALAALYASWVFWVYALLMQRLPAMQFAPWRLAARPEALARLIRLINATGAWSIGKHGEPVKGAALWVIWIAEAACVLAAAVIAARKVGGARPFCETCGRWCSAARNVFSAKPVDPAELKRQLEARDFDFLRRTGAAAQSDRAWFQINLFECEQCQSMHALSAVFARLERDKKGNDRKVLRTVVDKLLISPKEAEALRSLRSAAAQQPASQAAPSPQTPPAHSPPLGEMPAAASPQFDIAEPLLPPPPKESDERIGL